MGLPLRARGFEPHLLCHVTASLIVCRGSIAAADNANAFSVSASRKQYAHQNEYHACSFLHPRHP